MFEKTELSILCSCRYRHQRSGALGKGMGFFFRTLCFLQRIAIDILQGQGGAKRVQNQWSHIWPPVSAVGSECMRDEIAIGSCLF